MALVTKSSSTTASKLFASEKYSDLTIICHGRQFKVHKAILCPQSEVISKICDIDMQEKKTGIIEHKEFDDDTTEHMIEFAYKKEYEVTRRPKYLVPEEADDSTTSVDSRPVDDVQAAEGIRLPGDDTVTSVLDGDQAKLSAADKWVIHARVYGLAEYYDMSELRDEAHSRFMHVAGDELGDIDLSGFHNVAREVCRTTMREDGSGEAMYERSLRSGFLSLVALYAPKLALDADFSAALYTPDLQGILVDIIRVFGQRMSELEVQKEEDTSSLEAEKEALKRSMETTKADADNRISAAEHRRQIGGVST